MAIDIFKDYISWYIALVEETDTVTTLKEQSFIMYIHDICWSGIRYIRPHIRFQSPLIYEKGSKNENGRVALPESVPIHHHVVK